MKKTAIAYVLFYFLSSSIVFAQNNTNDFYDDSKMYNLQVAKIQVLGEVENKGTVKFSKLPKRSIIVKETEINKDNLSFIGTYSYEGYSLYDILNKRIIKKRKDNTFNPIIDLYVEIINQKGESVILSWGELYYPSNRHKIIIATNVRRIIPSKEPQLWPLPKKAKLVVAMDLISERNISNPIKIIVHSAKCSLVVRKNISPIFSPKISIYNGDTLLTEIQKYPLDLQTQNYLTVFYGRGRGIHGISEFKGVALKEILKPYFPQSKENIKNGLFIVGAQDGYRGVFTYSEIFNRNDQSETLLINRGETDGGKFSLFPSADFFSDRAIKSVTDIIYKNTKI